MGVGRGRGLSLTLDFKNFSKKDCFLNFEWEKKSHHFWLPPGKILENSPGGTSLEKNPSDAHVQYIYRTVQFLVSGSL